MDRLGVGDIASVIRAKLISEELPGATPEKCWVGKGTERPCMGCDLPIPPDAIEYEVDLPAPPTGPPITLRFHRACLAIWHQERVRLTAEGD